MKKHVSFILSAVLLISCVISPAYADGFCDDPVQINEAAKSVMMLEVYKDGELIKTGSGFVAFDNRHLVTNYHVADEAETIYAYSDAGDPYIIMDVCIADSKKDLAILQFFSPTDLKPLELNETGEVIRASSVVAIGSPKGFSNTVSKGNVSSLYEEDGVSYIQFTAPISSGSSGGALFDNEGKIIGITTLSIVDREGAVQNLNFAVRANEVSSLYDKWNGDVRKLSDLSACDNNTSSPETEKPSFSEKGYDEGNRISLENLTLVNWAVKDPKGVISNSEAKVKDAERYSNYNVYLLCELNGNYIELVIQDYVNSGLNSTKNSLWNNVNSDMHIDATGALRDYAVVWGHYSQIISVDVDAISWHK